MAQARGKATSSVIGIRAMGQRFNVLMTIQVPLQQARRKKVKCMDEASGPKMAGIGKYLMNLGGATWGLEQKCLMSNSMELDDMEDDDRCRESLSLRSKGMKPRCGRGKGLGKGVSSAARVSRGTEHDVWSGLAVKAPKRNAAEHVTVTVVIYNTAP